MLYINGNRIPIDSDSDTDTDHTRRFTRYASACPPSFEKSNTSRFIESVTYQGPKLWADLPTHVLDLNDAMTLIEKSGN